QSHADASVAPRHLRFNVDVLLDHRYAEPHLDGRALLERIGRADGDAAAADVQGDRGGDRVAEAVGDWNAEYHARPGASIELAGEEMRRERGEDVLHRGVLVDVAADVERGKLADLRCACDRSAEDDNRRSLRIDVAQRAYEIHAVAVRQPEINDNEIDCGEVGLHAGNEL